MIYKKDANFPYPVLSSTSLSYEESDFTMKVRFEEDQDLYRFKVDSNLTSSFMERLLRTEQAQYVLVIQSKDTKFFKLPCADLQVAIPRNRMSLMSRTSIQLHIVSKSDISFATNTELNHFYTDLREQLVVPKFSMIGYSNIVTFEGGMKNPLELFKKRLNPNLPCAIKYELGSESIIIHFRDEDTQFPTIPKSGALLNPYLYTGLRIALARFIQSHSEESEDVVEIQQIQPPENLLDYKLYNLMQSKAVHELSVDTIDEVIDRISYQMIEKYVDAVKELATHED